MVKYRTYLAIFVTATFLAAVPVILGFPWGAGPGFSGGPAGNALNCTACHQPFNIGTGLVELLGAPRRYRAGETYDLIVRIDAPDQDGAGFEISAEGIGGHEGALLISDPVNTQYAGGSPDYVTHTFDGVEASRANWIAKGGSYDYHLRWEAPSVDVGPITFFTAVNAVDNDFPGFGGVRYYATYATSQYARPGDADGDTDSDLTDYMKLAGCFSGPDVPFTEDCEQADTDGDGDADMIDVATFLATFTGPTATLPAEYVLADVVRGGLLYDKWWVVNGAAEPTGNHPLYPGAGQQSGSTTFRCKECHGWDYKGHDGAYAFGSTHFTDIVGVQGTALTPQQLFDLLKSSDTLVSGHDMAAFGMGDDDLWDVVKMTLEGEGVIETDDFISPTCNGGANDGDLCMVDGDCVGGTCDGQSVFDGNAANGQAVFNNVCFTCHGVNGDLIDFGGGEIVGTVASGNPWEFLHTVRFGHPGAPMPSFELLHWEVQRAADVGAHAATLPQ